MVQAHPSTDSFNQALLQAALRGLATAGHQVDVLALYEEKYEPVMSLAERRAYESDQPILSEHVQRHADLLLTADAIVFVYPTWWWGMPAMLKGWMERTLVMGVAFELDPKTSRVRPKMDKITKLAGITTYGSSRTYMRFFTDGGRRTIARTLRLICGRRCRTTWLGLYSIDTASVEDRNAFVAKVETKMTQL